MLALVIGLQGAPGDLTARVIVQYHALSDPPWSSARPFLPPAPAVQAAFRGGLVLAVLLVLLAGPIDFSQAWREALLLVLAPIAAPLSLSADDRADFLAGLERRGLRARITA